jgi:uncharacterized Zn-finger protein
MSTTQTVAVSPTISESSNAGSMSSSSEEPSSPQWDSNIVFAASPSSPTLAIQSLLYPLAQQSALINYKPGTRKAEEPFKCSDPVCGRLCKSRSRLARHERMHKGEKPYVCPYPGCGHAFQDRYHLSRHERMHNGERPFGCPHPYCLKRFSRRDNMEQHMKTHRTPEYMDPMFSKQVHQGHSQQRSCKPTV